jgi:hypothetical protein
MPESIVAAFGKIRARQAERSGHSSFAFTGFPKGAEVAKGTPRIVMSNFSPWRIAADTSAKRFPRSATVTEFMRDKVS